MMGTAKTILIVDDDADIGELIKIFLEEDGYLVEYAADGVDALAKLNAGLQPALILLDLMMPRMDGEQFLKQLTASEFGKIPVVIISGHSAVRKTAREFNVSGFLVKPIEFSELLQTVRRFAPEPARLA
jgi:two-component system, chemotaxis family, chemotaxis protein CheY